MVYLEKQKKGIKIYYYLSKTIRLSNNKFRKIRQPVGSSSKEYSIKEENNLIKQYKPAFEKLLYDTDPMNLTDFKHEIFWDKTKLYYKEDIKDFNFIKKTYKSWKKNMNLDLQYKIEEQILIKYIYDTNRSEGNTFTLSETELFLTKGIINKTHKKREIYEIENTKKALNFIKNYSGVFDLKFIKKVHKMITSNTLLDPKNESRLRRKGEDVRMENCLYICPLGGEPTRRLLKETINLFLENYKKNRFDSIVKFYSAFIAVHPFVYENGITSRILLNWLLLREGLPLINFDSNDHHKHCNLLNNFANGKDKLGLSDYIYDRIKESSVLLSTKK